MEEVSIKTIKIQILHRVYIIAKHKDHVLKMKKHKLIKKIIFQET